MAQDIFANDALFQGNVTFTGTIQTKFARSQLAQDDAVAYPIPLTSLRVFDAFQTNLPGTAASDDLGLIGGTFGTASPVVQTSDAKATTVTQKARFMVQLPQEYQTGETVTIRAFAGMDTTVSDGTATIDFSAYEVDGDGGIGSDIVTTAATTINNLTNAAKDFQLDASGLVAGDILDCQVTIAITDTATGTAVLGEIGYLQLLCDVKG